MNWRWRAARDIGLGVCFILSGLYLLLLPGLTRGTGLPMRFSGWYMRRWIKHKARLEEENQ